jgi:hypothetical protein
MTNAVIASPPYGPTDAMKAPRYTGIRTFARCPFVSEPAEVDVGFNGIPSTRRQPFEVALASGAFPGFDLVEVAPAYDLAGQTTALLAANLAYEFLALTALA